MAKTISNLTGVFLLKIAQIVRIFAGSMILISLLLGVAASPIFVSTYFLWVTTFVGANLLQSGFTKFCPLEVILAKMGVSP